MNVAENFSLDWLGNQVNQSLTQEMPGSAILVHPDLAKAVDHWRTTWHQTARDNSTILIIGEATK